jgi:hypothetical protein
MLAALLIISHLHRREVGYDFAVDKTYMKLRVVFTEALSGMEYLFAVRTAPCKPLLVELLLV